jgi:hypothetical protein
LAREGLGEGLSDQPCGSTVSAFRMRRKKSLRDVYRLFL